jgi:hypothetical protein
MALLVVFTVLALDLLVRAALHVSRSAPWREERAGAPLSVL